MTIEQQSLLLTDKECDALDSPCWSRKRDKQVALAQTHKLVEWLLEKYGVGPLSGTPAFSVLVMPTTDWQQLRREVGLE